MPPGKRKKLQSEKPIKASKPKTLAGVSQAALKDILGDVKEINQNDHQHLDQISKTLQAPRADTVNLAVCGAPAHKEERQDSDSETEWGDMVVASTAQQCIQLNLDPASAKERAKRHAKEERALRKQVSQILLMFAVARGVHYDRATDDSMLQSFMMSLLPEDLIADQDDDSYSHISELITFFNQTFTCLNFEANGRIFRPPVRGIGLSLLAAVKIQKGNEEDLNTLFVALLKVLGYQARSVRLLTSEKNEKLPRKRKSVGNTGGNTCWCEVWMQENKQTRWVHVNPLLELIDSPTEMDPSATEANDACVVAFYGGGVKDVSVRYITSVKRCEQLRKDKRWIESLQPLNQVMIRALSAAPSSKKRVRTQTEREDEDLRNELIARRNLPPKTIEDFKYSLSYILPRHILRYQAMKPFAKPVGEYRNEAYYNRSDLVELHSVSRWIRQGRVVKESEIPKPYKQVKKLFGCGKKETSMLDDLSEEEGNAGGDEMLGLYGHWQTKKWKVPVAKNGIVPKNQFGKVDVPPLAPELPKNTTHVALPGLVSICRKMDIDFALATVGFENVRRGKQVPKIDGVVVCSEYADQVIEAYNERERKIAEEERKEQMLYDI